MRPFFFTVYSGVYGFFWYFALQSSALPVVSTLLYLQRPLAMLLCLLSLFFNSYLISPPMGFEWFIPALFIKIVYGHLLQGELYRPLSERDMCH